MFVCDLACGVFWSRGLGIGWLYRSRGFLVAPATSTDRLWVGADVVIANRLPGPRTAPRCWRGTGNLFITACIVHVEEKLPWSHENLTSKAKSCLESTAREYLGRRGSIPLPWRHLNRLHGHGTSGKEWGRL